MRALLVLLAAAVGGQRGARAACDDEYLDSDALLAALEDVHAACPDQTRLFDIGESAGGRTLGGIELSAAPGVDDAAMAEVRFIANMHGNEVVGREVLLAFAEFLCNAHESGDAEVEALLAGSRIFLLPSMNPDGFEAGSRYTTAGVDLNRDFPDQFVDAVDSAEGREAETAAVMGWLAERDFDLAANLHGGALLVSYGWDGTASGASVYSESEDDALLRHLADTYVGASPSMTETTNGADWYNIYGGLQDYSYVWHHTVELTLEVSSQKCPAHSQIGGFQEDNVPALLALAQQALLGVEGYVLDANGSALVGAQVEVEGAGFSAEVGEGGFFRRLLAPGTYTLTVRSSSGETQTLAGVEAPGAVAVSFPSSFTATALSGGSRGSGPALVPGLAVALLAWSLP